MFYITILNLLEKELKMMKKHHETAPEDKLSMLEKIYYGTGMLANNLLGAATGALGIVLNLGVGLSPAKVGLLMSIPRFFDALTDPIMGYVSDNTSTKWGRRRPYIFAGAIIAGLFFILMWQIPTGFSKTEAFWYFLIMSLLYYVGYTIFATPFIALGYELTPDYHERSRLMGVANIMGQIAWAITPWFYRFTQLKKFGNQVVGAKVLAVVIGLNIMILGIVPAIFLKEKLAKIAEKENKKDFLKDLFENVIQFFKGFVETFKSVPFVKLCIATFLVFNGFMTISGFSSYIFIYYIYGNAPDVKKAQELGSNLIGAFGTTSSICTFIAISLVAWLATKIGKHKAFLISTSIAIVGYILKWFCYNPQYPKLILLTAPLISFGLGGLFTTVGAMLADVCDLDELKTGKRREGMFGAVYWWMVKLGMSVAFAAGGFILAKTGFNADLGLAQSPKTIFLMRIFDVSIPVVTYIIAILVMLSFEIDEDKAYEIRAELEKRRGKA